ncbi:hypothetical protein [Bacillus sp. B15-48]|uniref:hypothetical protein n=1 Tax=Bacillus sp. B15-48 TaxID=1548601 RepID=UPI00193EFD3C|nr:hypothetical protein [Bacillus sp. B15-48]MBM4765470.1 hypothetical protein [Bacillus sp. B15-48]
MIKRCLILIVVFLLMPTINALATTIHYAGYVGTGTSGSTPGYFLASQTDLNDFWVALTVGGASGEVVWYSYSSGGSAVELGRNSTPANNIKAPSGANAFKLFSTSSGEVYAIKGDTTNTNAINVIFQTPAQTGTGDIFTSPGWQEHMGKLNQILNAIPTPPNWEMVAGTFRDIIAPRIKTDLQQVLGSTQTPATFNSPDTPTAPATPGDLGGLNNRGITSPTGGNAPGLGDSGFSSGDIKNNAPIITERADPNTGGFTINNPILSLPSQDEFRTNIPTNPDIEGITEPTLGQEPTYQEPTYSEPSFQEPTYQEPTYSEPSFQEPTYSEPKINYETAPTPTTEGGTTEPLTGDFNSFPIPSTDTSTAPIPGN